MKTTSFFESHKALGALFVPFAGWKMPFSYGSPWAEHLNVRQTGGIFDVSHMGQIRIRGPDSLNLLKRLVPTRIKDLPEGRAQYSVLCRENGCLIDDLVIYALSPLGQNYLLCVNASFKDKDLQWIRQNLQKEKAIVEDESHLWDLAAVQGPKSVNLCEKVFPEVDFRKIPRFGFKEEGLSLAQTGTGQAPSTDLEPKGQRGILFSRTGYTGEQGFEIYIPREKSKAVWNQLIKEGKALGNDPTSKTNGRPISLGTDNKERKAVSGQIMPIGLGARDTLRLEMAYLLAGQDFDESKTPLQAGLSRLLKSEEDYIGRKAIEKQKGKGPFLKGFIVEGPSAVPRRGAKLYNSAGREIGIVTSGAKSPSLNKMIGLAYWTEQPKMAWIDLRGEKSQARLVKTPFLKKTSS